MAGYQRKLISLLSLILFLFSPNVFAGDVLPAGTVLEEDSYVFTIEEATSLLQRVEELEKKEESLNYYIDLDALSRQKFTLYESNIDLLNFQITEYNNIVQLNGRELERMHKRARLNWLENYGMLILGAVITTTGFIIVDQITDNAILP